MSRLEFSPSAEAPISSSRILHLLFDQKSVSQFPSISPPDPGMPTPPLSSRYDEPGTQAWPSKALDTLMGSEEEPMRGLPRGFARNFRKAVPFTLRLFRWQKRSLELQAARRLAPV